MSGTDLTAKSNNYSFNDYSQLTDEELLDLAQNNDLQAQEHIISKYKNMVRAKARPYFLVGADWDDIVQEGMIGLFKAMRDYDASKKASFRAFADLCISRQIITAIKAATRYKHAPLNTYISFNASTGTDDVTRTVEEIVSNKNTGDPEELFIVKEELSRIETILKEMLSNFENEVLRRYLDGAAYQEISKELGTHTKSVDNALQRVKKKLANALKR